MLIGIANPDQQGFVQTNFRARIVINVDKALMNKGSL